MNARCSSWEGWPEPVDPADWQYLKGHSVVLNGYTTPLHLHECFSRALSYLFYARLTYHIVKKCIENIWYESMIPDSK